MTAKTKGIPTTKTRKRKAKQKVWIVQLVDESYSMLKNRPAVVQSINEFVENLRKDDLKGKDMRSTLGMFDYHDEEILRIKFDGIPFEECKELTLEDYVPRGGTPLNDAVLLMIDLMEKKVGKKDKVMLVIMTDGEENRSQATSEDVNSRITKKEADGWAFIYLGANQDAWAEGGKIGVAPASTFNYTSSPTGTSSTIGTTSNHARAFATSSSANYLTATKRMNENISGTLAEGVVHDVADYLDKDEEDDD